MSRLMLLGIIIGCVYLFVVARYFQKKYDQGYGIKNFKLISSMFPLSVYLIEPKKASKWNRSHLRLTYMMYYSLVLITVLITTLSFFVKFPTTRDLIK